MNKVQTKYYLSYEWLHLLVDGVAHGRHVEEVRDVANAGKRRRKRNKLARIILLHKRESNKHEFRGLMDRSESSGPASHFPMSFITVKELDRLEQKQVNMISTTKSEHVLDLKLCLSWLKSYATRW